MTEITDKRIKTLNAVLHNKKDQDAVKKEFLAANGDWTKASASLKDKVSEETFKKASFAQSLADWSGDHVKIVKALAEQPDLNNMRDVALRYNSDKLAAMVDIKDVPETIAGTTAAEKKRNFAAALHRELFLKEPSAVLQRMVQESEIPIADVSVSTGEAHILSNLPKENRKLRDSWFNTRRSKSDRRLDRCCGVDHKSLALNVTPLLPVAVAKGILGLFSGITRIGAELAIDWNNGRKEDMGNGVHYLIKINGS